MSSSKSIFAQCALVAALAVSFIAILVVSTPAYSQGKCVQVQTRCPNGRWVTSSCSGTQTAEELCGIKSPSGSSSSSSSVPSGDSVGTILGTAIGHEIGKFLLGDPEEDARRKAEEGVRAEQQRRAKEETLRRNEEKKNRLLGNMMNVDNSPQLGLMGVDSGPELSLMTGDQVVSSSATSPNKANQQADRAGLQPKSTGFTKGFEDASQCYSQNSGSRCSGVAVDQQQTCLGDYRAGYSEGDKQRTRLMQEAMQAGQFAGERGELASGKVASGFANPLADGPCRLEWLHAYDQGYIQGKHAKAQQK